MDITLEWIAPLDLTDGSAQNLILMVDLEKVPEHPGIYIFGREFGDGFFPLYIGKAQNLRTRMKQQLNNAKLMNCVKKSKNGYKVVRLAKLVTKQGQQADRVLKVVETTYIENALSEGFELLNKQGVRTPVHTISSKGKKEHHKPFQRTMFRKAR